MKSSSWGILISGSNTSSFSPTSVPTSGLGFMFNLRFMGVTSVLCLSLFSQGDSRVTLECDCGGTIGSAVLGGAATCGAEVGVRDGVGTGACTGGSGGAGVLFCLILTVLGMEEF